jgi:hypothetical protein
VKLVLHALYFLYDVRAVTRWAVRHLVASVLALTIAPALEMTPLPTLDDFPMRTTDLIRYGDTDRQGHVNNAVFATFFETGRVAFLFDRNSSILPERTMLVIARLVIDFRSELNWPGKVEIGTRVEGSMAKVLSDLGPLKREISDLFGTLSLRPEGKSAGYKALLKLLPLGEPIPVASS